MSKYNKPEMVLESLSNGKVKESTLKQYITRYKKEGDLEKVCIIEEGLSMWEDSKEVAMCTYHDKPIDELTLREILNMYDKDKRLLTTNHCIRFTILMIEDSYISIKDYKGVVIHPRDLYLEEEEY